MLTQCILQSNDISTNVLNIVTNENEFNEEAVVIFIALHVFCQMLKEAKRTKKIYPQILNSLYSAQRTQV